MKLWTISALQAPQSAAGPDADEKSPATRATRRFSRRAHTVRARYHRPRERNDVMSGIESAFFGSLADDAQSKVSKAGKTYLRFRVRVGEGEYAQWVGVMCFDPSV